MKRSVMFLVLTGAFLLTAPLAFADVFHPPADDAWGNADSMGMSNDQGNAETTNAADNSEDNADVTKMPFVPDDNSDNGVLQTGK